MRRLAPGDVVALYSPRTQMRAGTAVQSFTAIGSVCDREPYLVPTDGKSCADPDGMLLILMRRPRVSSHFLDKVVLRPVAGVTGGMAFWRGSLKCPRVIWRLSRMR